MAATTPKEPSQSHRQPLSPLALSLCGMLAALIFVATAFLKLPIPMTGGYVHLGDGFVLLGAALLHYLAVPAAAVGSLLADIMLGYGAYALPSFLIKGAVAAVAVRGMQSHRLGVRILWLSLAELCMILGYFLLEWLLMGYGFIGAWANVPGNALQGVSGVVIALLLAPMLKRLKMGGRGGRSPVA